MGKRIERISGSSGGGGGGGEVNDVKVNNVSVVNAEGVANVDLTEYIKQQTDINKEYPQGRIIDFPTNPSSALGGTWEEVNEWTFVKEETFSTSPSWEVPTDWKEMLIIVTGDYNNVKTAVIDKVAREVLSVNPDKILLGCSYDNSTKIAYTISRRNNVDYQFRVVDKGVAGYTADKIKIYVR